MHATKLVNKKIIDFLQKIHAFENAHRLTSLVEKHHKPNRKRFSTLAMKGTAVLKNSTNKVCM